MKTRPTQVRKPTKENRPPKMPEVVMLSAEQSRRNNLYQYYFIAFFAFVLYANTLTFDYTLDDALVITQNSFTKKGLAGIKSIMTNDQFMGFYGTKKKLVAGGRYRPLSQVVFAIQYQFFGMKPFVGHLFNVLFYVFVCVFLFFLLKRLIPDYHSPTWYRSLPFLAAVIFTAHPLHTEIVANIKGFDEILAETFTLPSVFFLLKYLENRKFYWLILAFVLFYIALLTRETQITFLAVVPLCLYFFRKVQLKDYVITLLPLLAALVLYLPTRYFALGGDLNTDVKVTELLNNPYLDSSVAQQTATNMYTWGKYLFLLFFPHPLTHDYYPKTIAIIDWPDLKAVIPLIIYAGLGLWAILKLKSKHILSFAILLFFITFSISSNVVFNLGTFMNERYMFFPLLGFAFCVVYFVRTWLRKKISNPVKYKQVVIVFWVMLFGLYSVKTISRNFTWKNDFTLFTTDAQTSSNSAKCNVSAGGMYIEKAQKEKDESLKAADLDKAEHYLTRGLEIYPGYSAGWVLLGNVYLERKNYPQAKNYYINCLTLYPGQPEATNKLTYVAYHLSRNNDAPDALSAYQMLLKLQPQNMDFMIQIADQLSKMNKVDTAMIMLNSMVEKDPGFAGAYSKIGEIYGRVYNNMPKAEEYLSKAYSMDPKNGSTLENLGIVYGFKKNFPLSIEFFKKALAIDSVNPRVLSNLGNTYALSGDSVKAQECFRKAKDAAAKARD